MITVLLILAPAIPVAAASQQAPEARLRSQQQELDRLRRERQQLEQRMRGLQGTMRDLSSEISNIERQAETTARLVRSLDSQLGAINFEVQQATGNLLGAEDELAVKRAVLRRRLSDIYKRGPLYSAQVLLSAESFGDLVARYKYLHLVAKRDQALVQRVESLRNQIGRQRALLVRLQNDMEVNRQEKAAEERRLRGLEQQRAATLAQTRRSARQTESRLQRIARDETRISNLIVELEAARRRAAAAGPAGPRAPSTFSTRDVGRFDWPVEGLILYQFGRIVNPNNTAIRRNGIAIAADAGTPVRSVAAGTVMFAETMGTYGLTVILQHPGGDYSIYGSLSSAAVQRGAIVDKGQTLGTVGVSDPDLGPHLYFEIRIDTRAVDPLTWLRGRG